MRTLSPFPAALILTFQLTLGLLVGQDAVKPRVIPEDPADVIPKPKVIPEDEEEPPAALPGNAPAPPAQPMVAPTPPVPAEPAEPAAEIPKPATEPTPAEIAVAEEKAKQRELEMAQEKQRKEQEAADRMALEKEIAKQKEIEKEKAKEAEMAAKEAAVKEAAAKEAEEKANRVVKARAVAMEEAFTPPVAKVIAQDDRPQIKISSKNDKLARTLILTIPPPRGQIVDRHGEPLAQNKMAHFMGVQFPLKPELTDPEVIAFAKAKMDEISRRSPDKWEIPAEKMGEHVRKILEHYKNRRWLPYLAPRPVAKEATPEMIKALPAGVVAQPCYLRFYPHGAVACHTLGEMGRKEGASTGLIQNGDSLWSPTEGKNGLESKFESSLAGTPGKVNLVFSAQGEKISEELIEAPIPGDTVVTTLDLFMQETCERALRAHSADRGAFVIVDIHTGDVVSLASNPGYDPNLFAFGVRNSDYEALKKDKNNPLFPRATMGLYPPASTFKVMTALAWLECGKFKRDEVYDCPNRYYVGDRFFYNYNRNTGEGTMDVVGAIKRSCNTWFYQAAIATGAAPVTSMAVRFGIGQRTGLPISESDGLMPTPEWWRIKRRHEISRGDLANIAIGQGDIRVTAVQDAMMMAGIAREKSLPKIRLVSQIQTTEGQIVDFFPPEDKAELQLSEDSLLMVQKGMRAVVGEGGTGKSANNDYVPIVGKTGTGQNGAKGGLTKYVTWFAGYVPYKNPQYAFATVYEGVPGESKISGGGKMAPIVSSVFNQIYARKKQRGESMSGPPTAVDSMVINAKPGSDSTDDGSKSKEKAKSSSKSDSDSEPAAKKPSKPKQVASTQKAPEPAPAAPEESTGGLRGLFRKLLGK